MYPLWEVSPVPVGVLLQMAGSPSPGPPPARDFHASAQACNGLGPLYKSANVSRGQLGAQVGTGTQWFWSGSPMFQQEAAGGWTGHVAG